MRTGNEEISLKELILKIGNVYDFLKRKFLFITLFGFSGAVLGLTYAYFKRPTFLAECSFVLEEGEKTGGLGAYAGLASMIGVDIGVGGGLFQEENIIRLYQSRSMIVKTLLFNVEFENKKQLLIERYIAFNKLQEKWAKDEDLHGFSFSIPQKQYSVKHDSLLTLIVNTFNKNALSVIKADKKSSIINVSFKSDDEAFAKTFTETLVSNVNNFYIETKTNKSLQNIRILQHQTDSIRRMLNSAISGVAQSSDVNPNVNPALQVLRVPAQRRSVDVQANSAILQELVKNLEIAKVSLRKETPLIQVIDNPVLPLKKEKLGKIKGAILGGFIFVILSVIFFLAQYFYMKIMN